MLIDFDDNYSRGGNGAAFEARHLQISRRGEK